MNITLNKHDEIVMKLLHYFITIAGYNPVILHGAKDEIWLENSNADYKVIRIVSNYIHNDEQLDFDIFKTKQILKRIKRKMFSFNMDTLSIFVNLGDNVKLDDKDYSNVKCANIKKIEDLSKYSFITDIFPHILEIDEIKEEGIELFIKLTDDINKKSFEETKKAEDVFTKKVPIVTYIIIAICTIFYLITGLESGNYFNVKLRVLYDFGGLVNYETLGKNPSELYRLVTSIFLHGSILHYLCNMYSLYIIGREIESFFGKAKYITIFLFSGIIGNLLSMLFLQNGVITIGASGAVFGLLGSMLYFGYHYRIYLANVLKSEIVPIIILNLLIGFASTGINNIAHIGGLIGGVLVSKAVGVKYKSTDSDIINGIIMTLIFVAFLSYMAFMR